MVFLINKTKTHVKTNEDFDQILLFRLLKHHFNLNRFFVLFCGVLYCYWGIEDKLSLIDDFVVGVNRSQRSI